MKEYQILSSVSETHLAEIVNESLNNGWIPLGGISVRDNYLIQAVAKPILQP